MRNLRPLRLLTAALLTALLTAAATARPKDEAAEARALIERVNDYWQAHHDCAPAEIKTDRRTGPDGQVTATERDMSAFWDHAAYQTGNMEAYRLTGKQAYLDYALRWARHNEWQGARGRDRARWRYRQYGESQDHVLFGDWQVCFQTYADLYLMQPDEGRIRRAREVMEYEMSLPQHDFWWWADALYMVMPVMTKMYRITGNERYLAKLYEYVQYSDSIMLDAETGLYFRDGKYVYPQHTTAAGLKDFWARGDGWVLAGLAKVLQDLPQDYRHRPFFEAKFRRLAAAVAALQQPEGYWTRSMADPGQAPGPETSGTAFFTYGLLWGVNNGLIDPDGAVAADSLAIGGGRLAEAEAGRTYRTVIDRAWRYLTTVAVQPSGRVGYVQPIGEKAIPGQQIDRNSEANFGTGAVLLAACEYVRHLEARAATPAAGTGAADRAYWAHRAYEMAQPILEPMARGDLQRVMRTEFSPSFDNRNRKVLYMEAFGRLMAGIAPWLALPDDDTAEGRQRRQLRLWALDAYRNAVTPESPDYLAWGIAGQNLVDAAYIAESFLRAYDALWRPLPLEVRQRYVDEFTRLRSIDPPYTNWLLFSSTIESFLARALRDDRRLRGREDEYRINSACRKMEEWYVGDGWYSDGPEFAFDYYSAYVFHPMYLETLQNMIDAGYRSRLDYTKYHARALKRAQRFSIILERFIAPDGTFPVFGRSIPYRLATMQPLALMAWYDRLPAGLTRGQVRAALTATMHRMYDAPAPSARSTAASPARNGAAAVPTPNAQMKDGYLTIGFCGEGQADVADWYTNNGSLYMTSLAFLPLGLPATHPFWTDAPQPWTQVKAWGAQPFPKDHQWKDDITTRDLW